MSVVLTSREVWQGWILVARRYALDPKGASKSRIAGALRRARKRASHPELAPAAVFYAFARSAAFPPPARHAMLYVLTAGQAYQLGAELHVSRQTLNQAAARVAGKLGKRWTFERLVQEVDSWLVGG